MSKKVPLSEAMNNFCMSDPAYFLNWCKNKEIFPEGIDGSRLIDLEALEGKVSEERSMVYQNIEAEFISLKKS